MSTTPGGLPYPETTGSVNQGANDIKALALAVQARGGGKQTQSGAAAVSFASGNATITYPVPFKAGTLPVVVAVLVYGTTNGEFQATMVRTPTATGVQVSAYQVSASNGWYTGPGTVKWIAVGDAA